MAAAGVSLPSPPADAPLFAPSWLMFEVAAAPFPPALDAEAVAHWQALAGDQPRRHLRLLRSDTATGLTPHLQPASADLRELMRPATFSPLR